MKPDEEPRGRRCTQRLPRRETCVYKGTYGLHSGVYLLAALIRLYDPITTNDCLHTPNPRVPPSCKFSSQLCMLLLQDQSRDLGCPIVMEPGKA